MHSVVIRKSLIRNGTSKASNNIWSRGDLATSWKAIGHIRCSSSCTETCRTPCKSPKDGDFPLQTCFFSYTETYRTGNGAFKAWKWTFQNSKCKFWTKLLSNAAQALSNRDQLKVLINGVVNHFMRKVKKDDMLVIADSVKRSTQDWNNISKPEDNFDEVREEEDCCLAWVVLLHFLYFVFGTT